MTQSMPRIGLSKKANAETDQFTWNQEKRMSEKKRWKKNTLSRIPIHFSWAIGCERVCVFVRFHSCVSSANLKDEFE